MNALVCNNIIKNYKNFQLNIDDYTIKKGTITALLGSNGAGKTTLIKLILNLSRISEGEIKLFGEDNDNAFARRGIGYLPENFEFPIHFTFREVLKYYTNIFNYKSELDYNELANDFKISKYFDTRIKNLSKGMKQSLGLLISIINGDRFLIIDEPFSGLDPEQKMNVKNFLKMINRNNGTTVLLTTHVHSDLDDFAIDLSIMQRGKIIANSKITDLNSSIEEYYFEKKRNHG